MEMRSPRSILLPLLAVLLAMAGFQIGGALSKGLFPAVGPQGAAAVRLALAAPVLLAVSRPWRTWPRNAPVMAMLGLGVSSAVAMLLFYMALARLPQGIAIALQFLGPLSIAVLGSRRLADLLWALLAAAGVWGLVGAGVERVRALISWGSASRWPPPPAGRATSCSAGWPGGRSAIRRRRWPP